MHLARRNDTPGDRSSRRNECCRENLFERTAYRERTGTDRSKSEPLSLRSQVVHKAMRSRGFSIFPLRILRKLRYESGLARVSVSPSSQAHDPKTARSGVGPLAALRHDAERQDANRPQSVGRRLGNGNSIQPDADTGINT